MVERTANPTALVTVPFSPEHQAAIEKIFESRAPRGRLLFVSEPDEVTRLIREADLICTRLRFRDALRQAERLSWLQTIGHGIDRYLSPELRARSFIATNCPTDGYVLAEHILMVMLGFVRVFPQLLQAQREQRWAGEELEPLSRTLFGQTVGLLGVGHIGQEVASRARAFGMRVLGLRRSNVPKPEWLDVQYDRSGLPELLSQADHVVISLPNTDETKGMIGEQQIRQMKPTAYLYNVGRAATTDEQAVIRALREGWIAGAALDVFDQEPLPPDSPLWTLPNAIVTPHIAGERPGSWDDLARVYTENLRRYLDGEPLIHTVDVVRGY